MSIPPGRFTVMSRDTTCLVQHIDDGLRVIAGKATNPGIHIFGREDGPDQGGEFIWDKLAPEQSSKGWTVEIPAEKEELGNDQRSMPDRRMQGQFLQFSDTEVIEAL